MTPALAGHIDAWQDPPSLGLQTCSAPSTDYPPFRAIEGVTYQVADSPRECRQALRVVYDAYVRAGLTKPNSRRVRETPFHSLPTTDVFVALHQGSVICTMTLIQDSGLGLPLEAVYRHEVLELRASGLRLAEVSSLADRPEALSRSRMFQVFVNLVGLLIRHARNQGVEQLLIAVHPRHEFFYKHFLGCERFGGVRAYPAVHNHLAVACRHDFVKLDESPYPLYEQIYELGHFSSRRPKLQVVGGDEGPCHPRRTWVNSSPCSVAI
jgi:hypothetical protein